MKIDSCDPPFLPGKQKWRAGVMCERLLLRMCVCEGGAAGSIMPGEGEDEEGRERCQTKRTRRDRGRESGSDRDRAMRGGQKMGGWALCREEVICQIGFHSLLGLRAACQPGRLTVSDSPPCISAYTLMHTQALTPNNVPVRLAAL